MGKRILGWLRQRIVGVVYGVFWFLLVCVSACFVYMTLTSISKRVSLEHAGIMWQMYVAFIGFPGLVTLIGALRRCDGWRVVLTMRLILSAVCLVAFYAIYKSVSSSGMAFYVGEGKAGSGIVSTYEALFIYVLVVTCALFQCWLIASEAWRHKVNAVVGGVLFIIGIFIPKLVESWSVLSANCDDSTCGANMLDAFVLFEMAVAYAATLSVMYIVGMFSSSLSQTIRSCAEFVNKAVQGSSFDDSQNADVPVSESEGAAASNKRNKESEVLPASSSVVTRVSQDAADSVVIPAQDMETPERARGSGDAVSKQLMSAAVSGLIAGACFSVASRLFSRR